MLWVRKINEIKVWFKTGVFKVLHKTLLSPTWLKAIANIWSVQKIPVAYFFIIMRALLMAKPVTCPSIFFIFFSDVYCGYFFKISSAMVTLSIIKLPINLSK